MPGNARLTGKPAVIAALAQGHSAIEAARAGGVNERTVRRWQKRDDFRSEVNRRRSQLLDETVGALVDAASDAVTTLRLALGAEDDAVKVRAARAILSALIVVRESSNLEERILALEEADLHQGGLP